MGFIKDTVGEERSLEQEDREQIGKKGRVWTVPSI